MALVYNIDKNIGSDSDNDGIINNNVSSDNNGDGIHHSIEILYRLVSLLFSFLLLPWICHKDDFTLGLTSLCKSPSNWVRKIARIE